MKLSSPFRTLSVFTAFLALAQTALAHKGDQPRARTTLEWHTDAEKAFAESKETGLPVLAVFR